jgi:thiamine-monophosphate kinase|tara:strand:+ start:2021 stop:2854 length:834 start_codon:yes stop_codon:yes gene_type:complete
MGDDTAVLKEPRHNLLTTDSLVYGRHFDDSLSAELAGAKLLKRNLSDIAAMGGQPGVAVLAGFLPSNTSISWIEQFVTGLRECAREWGVLIVGGDLTQTDDFLGFNLTLNGTAARPVLRGASESGDLIWVTGELGGSIHGHHAEFRPRLKEGQYLANEAAVHSMIDVTDGLAKDLPTLLSDGLAAEIDLNAIPLRDQAQQAPHPLAAAFTDGEDYELLFTTSSDWIGDGCLLNWETNFKTRLSCIGRVVTRPNATGQIIDAKTDQPINYGEAYEHFR